LNWKTLNQTRSQTSSIMPRTITLNPNRNSKKTTCKVFRITKTKCN